MTLSKSLAVAALVLAFAAAPMAGRAQDPPKPSQDAQAAKPAEPPAPPAARPEDVASPDAILAACYNVISGPAGQRDWDRFRSLFVPGARLIPTQPKKDSGGTSGFVTRVITPDEYAKLAGAYFEKNGFVEKEISRKSERYGNIMQVFSTYASRHDAKDPEPFERGINSFQLLFDGSRWWIVTIYWEGESEGGKIPAEFLPAH